MKTTALLVETTNSSVQRTQPPQPWRRFCKACASVIGGLVLGHDSAPAQSSFQPAKCAPPPDARYSQTTLKNYHSSYPNLAVPDGWSVRHQDFDACIEPPSNGGSQDHHFNSSVELHLANGACLKAPAPVTVRVIHTNDVGCASFYSTEMLQLDVAGGELPAGMRIRQSPVKRSLGQLSIQPAEGGGYLMDSFFDIWTDLSLDGGQTWTAATNSSHMALTNNSPELLSGTNRLPALETKYASEKGSLVLYCTNGFCCTNGIIVSNIVHGSFTANQPLPPLGSNALHSFGSQVDFRISLDGGATFAQHHAPANSSVLVSHTKDIEGTQFFETEMLQLDIQGGTLPAGIRIRESPSKASRGRGHIRSTPEGFMIGSYFNIYTELSLDGGNTWTPACCPELMALEPPPTYPDIVQSLNPLGYWQLNERTQPPSQLVAPNLGTLGASGNGRYGGGIPGAPGALVGSPDTAVRFNGAVGVPYSPPLSLNGPFTAEVWLKAAAPTTGFPCPLSCGTFGTDRSGWLIYQNGSSGWNFRMYDGVGANTTIDINAGGSPVPGTWYHLAAVFDNGTATLYVNGAPTPCPLSTPFNPNVNGPLTIGMRSDANNPWPGTADEVAIYPSALSPGTISVHFQNGRNPSPPIPYNQLVLQSAPMIYLRLDEPALPMAVNSGVLGVNANGFFEPMTVPGIPGLSFSALPPGLDGNNYACRLNGPLGYVDIPGAGLDLLGPVTVMAWCKADPANGIFQTIVGKGDSSYRLDMDWNGYPRFADGDPSVNPDAVGTTRMDDGQWHFLTGVYDGSASNYLYLDGLIAGSADAVNPIGGNAYDVWIGGAPDYGSARIFAGAVDDVAIFPYALSPTQILKLYVAALNAPLPSGNISIGTIGDQVQLKWCSGTLQSASEVFGPYNNVPNATSPRTFSPAVGRQFFRLQGVEAHRNVKTFGPVACENAKDFSVPGLPPGGRDLAFAIDNSGGCSLQVTVTQMAPFRQTVFLVPAMNGTARFFDSVAGVTVRCAGAGPQCQYIMAWSK